MGIIRFVKMNGIGNDFLIAANDAQTSHLHDPDVIQTMSCRKRGVGFDQILLFKQPTTNDAPYFVDIYNADGSKASACGNGTRCVARYLMDQHKTNQIHIATEKYHYRLERKSRTHISMEYDFKDTDAITPSFLYRNLAGISYAAYFIKVPNPHILIVLDDDADFEKAVTDEAFVSYFNDCHQYMDGANLSIIQKMDDDHFRLLTYENGVGLTEACGTATLASFITLCDQGLCGDACLFTMPGGILEMVKKSPSIFIQTGATGYNFNGNIAAQEVKEYDCESN